MGDLHFLGNESLKGAPAAKLDKLAHGHTTSFGRTADTEPFVIENADGRLTAWLAEWLSSPKAEARDIYVRKLFGDQVLVLSGAKLSRDKMGAWMLSPVMTHYEAVG